MQTQVLQEELTKLLAGPSVDRDKVREVVCALVDGMKAEGAPPEKVLVAVKAAVLGTKPKPSPGLRDERDAPRAELLHDAVAWCIAQYYA